MGRALTDFVSLSTLLRNTYIDLYIEVARPQLSTQAVLSVYEGVNLVLHGGVFAAKLSPKEDPPLP